jgi:dUTP pyrophosphatase
MIMPTPLPFRRLPHHDPALDAPAYASAGAAGADLRACLPPETRAEGVTLAPLGRALIPTGLAAAVPEGFELQIRPRSGLALRKGVTVLNSPGTVDSDYRGEIAVVLVNLGDAPAVVVHGERIAQAVLAAVAKAEWREGPLDETDRGDGGFGSTGYA